MYVVRSTLIVFSGEHVLINNDFDYDFPPLENGFDYMESAIQHLQGSPSKRDLKYRVLHLVAAIEVSLKMRLSKEHWSLIFEDPRSVSLDKYLS